jgi:Zn-dependent protease with chaperone function
MPFLLIVFLTLACLPEVGRGWMKPPWIPFPWVSVTLTWLTVAATTLWAYRIATTFRRRLQTDPDHRDRAIRRYERSRFRHHLGLFVAYLLELFLFGWGWAVGEFWRNPEHVYSGAELLILAPFLGSLVGGWACYYDADRDSHQALQPLADVDPLARAFLERDGAALSLRPEGSLEGQAPFGGRWSYVGFKCRQNLVMVFIPVLLLIAQKELLRFLGPQEQDWDRVISLGGVLVVLAVFVCMPWIVRLVLNLRPLPDTPLRRRLLATANRLRFRCSDILLWNTHSGMANAMVVGILPWPRYVVFTDRLLTEFDADEVEAVFGHEIGHIRHHHMLYYFGFLAASLVVLGWLISPYFPSGEGDVSAHQPAGQYAAVVGPDALDAGNRFYDWANHQYLEALPLMGSLLVYIFVVFGFLSRRCERQADIYGCRAVSCSQRNCLEHTWDVQLAPRGSGLCTTGIRIFIRALEKVALVNGINRARPGFLQSWQHSTIARRVQFLQKMSTDPAVEPRFQRRVALLKWGLFVILGVVFLALNGWVI